MHTNLQDSTLERSKQLILTRMGNNYIFSDYVN